MLYLKHALRMFLSIAEEACALEACYVAAFRMKQRGLVLHEKLDKAAVSEAGWLVFCYLCEALGLGILQGSSAWLNGGQGSSAARKAGQGGGERVGLDLHMCADWVGRRPGARTKSWTRQR